MITSLYLNNAFRHQDRTFTFEKGLTGIIGPNESGKSLIVEMIRFALFGSMALRGKADDYKKLHVELSFAVKGSAYRVIRKGTKVELYRDEAPLASGTKPVNAAIIDTLGYDLTVFDVANACNQGGIEALSGMRPAERKAMVDRTIGLDILDEVIKHCGDQSLLARREAEVVERTLIEPVEPVSPTGYQPSALLSGLLTENRKLQQEKNQLAGWLQAAPPAPRPPAKCSVAETVEYLTEHQTQRRKVQQQISDLELVLKALKLPSYTSAELDALDAWWDMYDQLLQKRKLLAQGHLCCPSCNHEWPIAGEALADLGHVIEVEEPTVSRGTIMSQRPLIGNDQRVADLTTQINALALPADRSADLKLCQEADAAEAAYGAAMRAYDAYNSQREEKQTRFDGLADIDATVTALQAKHGESVQYEHQVAAYDASIKSYAGNLALAEAARARSDEYAEGKKRVAALKVQVKSHLLPSLNKVASIILNQMTGGERFKVEVDEDFEIAIDDQPIATLSGSGKAVANLAIRIALGQILTNKVFSVFFADEVDAAMDNDRAAYTAQALRRLTDLIGQVVIITHKRPETDHIIELKK
jgi:DNA repair exonuclease SbcCD ATPase subunit